MPDAHSPSLDFTGQVVIVTGAGRGIGRANALAFAARGAAVVVNDVGGDVVGAGQSPEPAQRVVDEIEAAGGRAAANFASVAKAAGAKSIVETALERFGRLDVLVNNAGIQLRQPIGELDEETLRRHIDVHLMGAYHLSRLAWPHLAKVRGRIVNTLSGLLLGMDGFTAYSAAKGGLFGFSRSLAVEGRQAGIAVNCVAPGAATRMMTEAMAGLGEEGLAALERAFPPQTVAQVVAYLGHRDCELQGECITVAGCKLTRYVLAETPGLAIEDITAERVRDAIGAVLDPSGLSIWQDTAASLAGGEAAAELGELTHN